jgi:putative ABC transport system permease protein
MVSIARQILLHDRLRFTITVVSLGVAIVMILYDLGMFISVTSDNVSVVSHASAEVWVAQKGETNLLSGSLVPVDILERVRNLEGVRQACAMGYSAGSVKISQTRQTLIIAVDPSCPLIQPWSVVDGDSTRLLQSDTIVVDDFVLRANNIVRIGDGLKLNDRDLKVVAITHGNQSFSSSFVYISLQTFELVGGKPGFVNFIAVQLQPGTDRAQFIRQVTKMDAQLAALPESEFKQATVTALIAQGVGMIFVVVFVGVLVGVLIISLTLYTATMEQLRDFAVLKALGATRWKIWGVVLEEAITETTVSFLIGLTLSFGVDALVVSVSGIRGSFPLWLIFASYAAMLLLALFGSLLSIRKATSVDPVMVFRA